MEYHDFFDINAIEAVYNERIKNKSGYGIDRVSARRFAASANENFNFIREKCTSGSYKFSPYLEKLILKGRKSCPRMISIPTIRDKLVLSILNKYLQHIYPQHINTRLPNHRIRNIKNAIAEIDISCLVVSKIDIKSYYTSIDRDILFKILNMDERACALIYDALATVTVPEKYSRNDRHKYYCHKGVPQGLPLSNILAELYASSIDRYVSGCCLVYDRYVDDIIAISRQGADFKNRLEYSVSQLNLKTHSEKTNFCCSNREFSYLGYRFIFNHSKVVVGVRRSNIVKLHESIAKLYSNLKKKLNSSDVSRNKIAVRDIIEVFVEELNTKIAGARYENKRYGWIYYYSEITDIEELHRLDSFVNKKTREFKQLNGASIKSFFTAYRMLKSHRDREYAHDYEQEKTIDEMIRWLRIRRLINEHDELQEDEIKRLYHKNVRKKIKSLEEDLGIGY